MVTRSVHTPMVLVPGLLVLALAAGCGGPREEAAPRESEAARDAAVTPDGKVTRLPIVDRSIAYHGGDIYDRARVALRITSASGSFHIDATHDGDRFEYVVTGMAQDRERRVRYTNASVERWENGEPVELDERTAQQSRDWVDARVYFPFLPFKLDDENTFKEDLGLEEWDGRQLRKVKVTFQPGTSTDADDEYLFWFDPDTGRMEQFAYNFHVGQGGVRFRRAYNWHEVGGMIFSDQENWAVNGQGIPVEIVTPEYVANEMELMSKVDISEIEVEPLS